MDGDAYTSDFELVHRESDNFSLHQSIKSLVHDTEDDSLKLKFIL